jgi:hypothetical protein
MTAKLQSVSCVTSRARVLSPAHRAKKGYQQAAKVGNVESFAPF